MKIGLIIYGNLDILSGGYLYDKKLVAYLQQQGHEVKLFAQPVTGYWGRLSHNLALSWANQIVAYNPDILLQDELNHPSLFLLNRYLKKRLPCPIITIVHLLYGDNPQAGCRGVIPQSIEKQYLQTVDGFIFNSKITQQMVETLLGPVSTSIIAWPGKDNLTYEIDSAMIKNRCHQDRPLQLLFVGNLIPRKGLDLLINGLANLPQERWHLTIIGDTEVDPVYVEQLKDRIKRGRLTQAIQFLGKIRIPSKLSTLMVTHDVLAVPSYYEGFGIVYVEALGAGLPVIAGQNGGGSEIIKHNEHGYLVSPTVAEITEHIAQLMAHQQELTRLSLNAYKHYADFPTWDESLAKIEAFLMAQL